MNTTTNTTTTAIDSVYVGDVEVPLARIHAMAPDELTQFFYWVARVEYQRGREDGWEDLAEAKSKAYKDGRYQGQMEGHAEAFEQYQAQLKAELAEHDCVEALNL